METIRIFLSSGVPIWVLGAIMAGMLAQMNEYVNWDATVRRTGFVYYAVAWSFIIGTVVGITLAIFYGLRYGFWLTALRLVFAAFIAGAFRLVFDYIGTKESLSAVGFFGWPFLAFEIASSLKLLERSGISAYFMKAFITAP